MITEPRGYPCQNLDVILPATPNCPEAAYSYVVAENNFIYPAYVFFKAFTTLTQIFNKLDSSLSLVTQLTNSHAHSSNYAHSRNARTTG